MSSIRTRSQKARDCLLVCPPVQLVVRDMSRILPEVSRRAVSPSASPAFDKLFNVICGDERVAIGEKKQLRHVHREF
eukprot:CAMPEP_0167774442 /NCGR_PEP_ID=MMETSP0111_2-20121227/2001_1 /TAXON_ID=91324 /ORGANISM="Lotharella globosa, Strain CCCM811" /LENGTH=76 /DNA_ID=CAMNT_0007664237 /DNA_START=122 /DNA_END=352 /DNA_ORIENTATION=-